MKTIFYTISTVALLYLILMAVTKIDSTVELSCKGTETSQLDQNPPRVNPAVTRGFKFNYWEFPVYNPWARSDRGWSIYYNGDRWTEDYEQCCGRLRRSISDVNADTVWVSGYWNSPGKEDAYKKTLIKLDRITGELNTITRDSHLQQWWEFQGICSRARKI